MNAPDLASLQPDPLRGRPTVRPTWSGAQPEPEVRLFWSRWRWSRRRWRTRPGRGPSPDQATSFYSRCCSSARHWKVNFLYHTFNVKLLKVNSHTFELTKSLHNISDPQIGNPVVTCGKRRSCGLWSPPRRPPGHRRPSAEGRRRSSWSRSPTCFCEVKLKLEYGNIMIQQLGKTSKICLLLA